MNGRRWTINDGRTMGADETERADSLILEFDDDDDEGETDVASKTVKTS